MAFVNRDKFNHEYTVVGLKPNKNGYPVGYLDAGSMLIKIEVTQSKKEGVDCWVRLTKLPKNRGRNNNSMSVQF